MPQHSNNKKEYVIQIITHNSERLSEKDKRNSLNISNNTTSQESTAIDNSKVHSQRSSIIIQSNTFTKNFLLSKHTAFDIPFNMNDDYDNDIDLIENDPLYNDSLLSNAFDSGIN